MNNNYILDGGIRLTSLGSQIIKKLNYHKYKLCESKYIHQLNIKLNDITLHRTSGILFIGSPSDLPTDIHILVAVDKKFEITSFGGNCHNFEISLKCAIRESIEEIFTLSPNPSGLDEIIKFLKIDPYLKYVYIESGEQNYYIMDISILGDFIRILCDNRPNNGFTYLYKNYVKKPFFLNNYSSVDYSKSNNTGVDYTFDILQYMKDFEKYHKKEFSNSYEHKEVRWIAFISLMYFWKTIKDIHDDKNAYVVLYNEIKQRTYTNIVKLLFKHQICRFMSKYKKLLKDLIIDY